MEQDKIQAGFSVVINEDGTLSTHVFFLPAIQSHDKQLPTTSLDAVRS